MADEYISKQAFNDAIREAVRKYPNTFYNGLETARQIAHDMDADDVVQAKGLTAEAKDLVRLMPYAVNALAEKLIEGLEKRILFGEGGDDDG